MDLILFLGYLRLCLLLCLVLLFSPFLFQIFLFLLDSSIHLSNFDASGRFVSRTFLFSLLLIFFLVLSHFYRVFSTLFFLPPFHLSFLYFSKSTSLPCLVMFIQQFFLHVSLFLPLSVLSLLFFPFHCFRFCIFYLIISFLTCSVIHFLSPSFFSIFNFTFRCFFADSFMIIFIVIISILIFFFCHSFRQFPFIVVHSTL